MEFRFTEEQRMIRDTVADFLAAVSDSAAVRQAMESDSGYDAGLWQNICTDMCWQAMLIPERYGGLGLGQVELAIVQEQMGRRLLCSPFFSTVCLASNALIVAGSEAQKTKYLTQIAAGETTATLGWMSRMVAWGATALAVDHIAATWRENENGYLLDGELCHVVDGHTSDLLVIAARKEDSQGADGISLFVCPANSAGIQRELLPTLDQTRRLATIRLNSVQLPADARFGDHCALEKTLNLARIALAAEQLGGCRQVLAMAVDYSKERVQFDRPIATFQAIKHKAADMMLQAESSCSAVYYAACIADEALQGSPLGEELAEAASIAKACCSDAYFSNAANALQIFGGVGFTWEYDLHLYFKRARATETFLGNADHHREKIAALILDQP